MSLSEESDRGFMRLRVPVAEWQLGGEAEDIRQSDSAGGWSQHSTGAGQLIDTIPLATHSA